MAIKISDLNPEYSNSESYLYEVSDDEMRNTVGGFFFRGRVGRAAARIAVAVGLFWLNRLNNRLNPQPQPPMDGGEEF